MESEKKYELIPSDKEGLYRVKALKDFSNVKKGDIGGFIQSENNLSHNGNCWIYNDAIVGDDTRIVENAVIRDRAVVCDNAVVYGNAQILNYAQVWGNAEVSGEAVVRNSANVYCNARVYGNATIQDDAVVRGDARIIDNAVIRGDAVVCGEAVIRGDAIISSDRDYIVFKNWWSSGRFFTWTRSNNMWKVGCFYGTGEQLIAKAYEDSEESGREYEKIVKYVEGVNNPYTQTLEKTWKYKIYLKLLSLKTVIAKLLR